MDEDVCEPQVVMAVFVERSFIQVPDIALSLHGRQVNVWAVVSLLVVLKKALLHSLGFHADDRLVCELVSEEVILIRVDKPTHAVSEQTPIDHRIDGLSFGL